MKNTITATDLIATIRAKKGAEIITVKTETDANLLKTGNPFGKVTKKSHLNILVGFDYERCVNNQRTREELESDFLAKPRKWGQRVDLKSIEHKGTTYLSTSTLNCYSVEYVDENGKTLAYDDVRPFIKKTQADQGIVKELIYRDFKITNIKEVSMRGTTLVVV